MNKRFFRTYWILLVALFWSCDKLIFREVECRQFQLTSEKYWNNASEGDSIVFINSTGIKNRFFVVDKRIQHRTKYISDTGCGCLDDSRMLMTNETDSIWFISTLSYIEDKDGNRNETVVFDLDDNKSIFTESQISFLETYQFDSLLFTNVKSFELTASENDQVKVVYFAKNIGVIRYELMNGESWINMNLTESEISIQSFNYSENTCD